jgi:hypothetical protein
MSYLVFNTLTEAQTALNLIDSKVRQRIESTFPEAIDEVGIIPKKSSTGELDPTGNRTTTWATIRETVTGKFVFPELTEDYDPLFQGIDFLDGMVGYTLEDYDPAWFPQEDLV